ncbi:phage holin family protein [Saccharibacillus sp. CPCC 101409]|uniref:phage holin family protein n=1 Tax=Saccharibacillus sp. CPCC 101409 TaxID=3058041 RepID=UPI0026724B75|nr:phage holin family protein [Saccharibacillus sp. CPCC 101409]MDO3408561.1 phage holin family protein [Saccharibacillus sp. CPCC 101409]
MGEQLIKGAVAAFGAVVGYLFGGWNMLINLLVILVVLDWLTGWAAAWVRGELRSRIGFEGIVRKVAIFVVMAIAHLVDNVLGDLHLFRDAVVFFYLANELLSVIENLGKIGVPMPPVIRDAVRIFESKSRPAENPQLIPEAQPELVKEEKAAEVETTAGEDPTTEGNKTA